VDVEEGAAARALAPAAKARVEAAPDEGCVKTPAGYVRKAEVVPVTLTDGPLQPAEKLQPEVHVGHVAASPYVLATPPVADHCAIVTSVHELAPGSEEDPVGHGTALAEPEGQ